MSVESATALPDEQEPRTLVDVYRGRELTDEQARKVAALLISGLADVRRDTAA